MGFLFLQINIYLIFLKHFTILLLKLFPLQIILLTLLLTCKVVVFNSLFFNLSGLYFN